MSRILSALPIPSIVRRSRVPKSLRSVTTLAPESEVDPRKAGLTKTGVKRIWAAVERLYESGIHPAIALCLRRNGNVVIDRAIGHTSGNGPEDPPETPKTLATPATPFNIYSASKAVTAMIAHLLDQRRQIHVDDPVAEYIPEFAKHGKEGITISHVLAHRAGVPNIPEDVLVLENLGNRDLLTDVLCETKPLWRPGRLLGYHAISGGFIIAEIVERVTGKNIREVLAEEILDPLGGFRFGNYGVDPSDVDLVAESYSTGPPLLPPIPSLMKRALGVSVEDAVHLSNHPRFLTSIVPAANVIATANELSRFFQLLLDDGTLDGVEIFEPRTIRRAISEQSYLEIDFTLGFPMRYGMGFMLGADWLSLYGPDTRHAFGHLGFTNVVGWADPDRGVAAALMTSGKPILYPELYYLWDVMRRVSVECPKVGRRPVLVGRPGRRSRGGTATRRASP